MRRLKTRLVTRKALLIALALSLAIPVAALATDAQPKQSPSATASSGPVRYSDETLSRTAGTNARDPNAILKHILDRYGGSAILEASFGPPLPGWKGTEDPSIPLPPTLRDGRWLYTTVKADRQIGSAVARAVWEADLVAGAVRDELHLAGAQGDLIASNVSVRLPDGRLLENEGGGVGMVAFAQSFSSPSDGVVRERINAAARQLNFKVKDIDVLHPLQAAPSVVVETSEPARVAKNADFILHELFQPAARYEGAYLEVMDRAGRPVFVQASAFRVGVGQRWIRGD